MQLVIGTTGYASASPRGDETARGETIARRRSGGEEPASASTASSSSWLGPARLGWRQDVLVTCHWHDEHARNRELQPDPFLVRCRVLDLFVSGGLVLKVEAEFYARVTKKHIARRRYFYRSITSRQFSLKGRAFEGFLHFLGTDILL